MPMPPESLPPRSKAPCYRDDAMAVVSRLRAAGHVAYFAGGCVRDLLLGREPKDYDVATDAVPKRVRELFHNTQAVGAAFGVILVRLGRSVVEVATFRSDGEYVDGRRPSEVRFTTAEEDARRRDFTINGLFLDPVENRIIDFVGGQADLAARVIRAIGVPDHRFHEDHLRLLRAVRFAARFEFEIEPATATAINRHAAELVRISPERIAEELRAMLPAAHGQRGWRALLVDFPGLGDVIFRFVAPPPPVEARRVYRSIFSEIAGSPSLGLALTVATLDWLRLNQPPGNPLAALLDRKTVHHATRGLRQALRISNDEGAEVEGSLEGLGLLLNEPRPPRVFAVKRFLARPTSGTSRKLLAAAVRAGHISRATCAEIVAKVDELALGDYAPAPLVTGDDLTASGLTPGPIFKRVLDATYDEQLEGRVSTREAAMGFALRMGNA